MWLPVTEPFDNTDWIKKMLASQRAIERSLEPYRRSSQLSAILQQVDKMSKLMGAQSEFVKSIDRIRTVVEGPARQLQQTQEQLNRVLKTHDIISALRQAADFSKYAAESYRRALPLNWRPLTYEQAEKASILTPSRERASSSRVQPRHQPPRGRRSPIQLPEQPGGDHDRRQRAA